MIVQQQIQRLHAHPNWISISFGYRKRPLLGYMAMSGPLPGCINSLRVEGQIGLLVKSVMATSVCYFITVTLLLYNMKFQFLAGNAGMTAYVK